MKLLSGSLLLLLAACQPHADGTVIIRQDLDQCRRVEIFERCLQLAPAGPQSTKYNDWAEVIDQCEGMAMRAAYRDPAYIKPECFGNNAPAPKSDEISKEKNND